MVRATVTFFMLIALFIGLTLAAGALVTAMTFAGYTLANVLYDLEPPTAIFVGHCLIYGIPMAVLTVAVVKRGVDKQNGNS